MTDVNTSAQAYVAQRTQELLGLHRELLELMKAVPLHDDAVDGGRTMTSLRPELAQQRQSNALLDRYRAWCDAIVPFLERSPTAPTQEFKEIHDVLSSYFALRRIGTVDHTTWRTLFEQESAHIVQMQLQLLENAEECFSLLDHRPSIQAEELMLRFVRAGDGRYAVFADSVRGEAQGEFRNPFGEREVENFILRYCDATRQLVRGWSPASLKPYVTVGERLFAALFTGSVRDLYMKHLHGVRCGEASLRINLRVAAYPDVAVLPWEYLYDGSDFVVLGGETTLTRFIDSDRPVRSVRVSGAIRIALTISAPKDLAALDTLAEVERLRRALGALVSLGKVRIDVAPDGSVSTLQRMLRTADDAGNPYHIWHFIGHGRYSDEDGATRLAFENEVGTTLMVSGFELGTLLTAHPALRVVLLNACEAARSGPEDSLSSVGAMLITRGVPSVVAMQFSVSDRAAICFAESFYGALATGRAVDFAVGEGRRAVFFMPNSSEWAAPVVMLRTRDGVLFEPSDR